MAEFIKYLSLGSGMLLVVTISSVSAFLFSFIKTKWIRWPLILVVPFIAAYSLYWSPVWFFNALSGEYYSWELFFVLPCYVAGVTGSVLTVFMTGRLRKYRDKP